jgi:hypothetical protein
MPPANPILQAASLTSINSPVPCRFLRRLQPLTRLYPSPWEGPSPQSRVPSCIPSSATPTHTKPSTFRAKRRAIMRSCRSHTQGLSITGGSLDDLREGVGIFNAGGMLTISHSMIADNTEVLENGGGVIFNINGTETITNGGLWTGGTGSARGKSGGTYRGAIGKTGRGTPLDLVLTAEGAPFEGRGCHRRQSTFARIFASITSAHTPE